MIPSTVIWSYSVGGAVFAAGLLTIFLRGEWQKSRGFDKLILFGPLFYAMPLAAFGTEHFTLSAGISTMVPKWIPWHLFWTYFIGACFIAAALSLVTKIQAPLAASLLALTFFLFVTLMDAPFWARHPQNQFALTLMLRELSFSGGPLALASTAQSWGERGKRILATVARYFIAVPVAFYGIEQFLRPDHVPGVPLERLTPAYVPAHGIWTYFAALLYCLFGIFLLLGKKTRVAATCVGATVLLLVLIVYVPIAVADRATIEGLNYLFDTLMFCGTVLLLAGAMPRES